MRKKETKIHHMVMQFGAEILTLPFGRRLVLGASTLGLLFLFFPWFSDNGDIGNAFSKAPIFGVIILLFTLFALLLLLREVFSKKGFLMGISHGTIFVFLFAQSMYTLILATFVLHEFTAYSSISEVKFGIGASFVVMGIGLAGAIFSKDFIPKGEDRKIFAKPHEVDVQSVHLKPDDQLSFDDYSK